MFNPISTLTSGDCDSTRSPGGAHAGQLIVNADDWGRDVRTTGAILNCVVSRVVSSVSAMVFMGDSERAATIARERKIDAGLHLNLTTPYSAPRCPASLIYHQQILARYLLRHRLAQVIYHPGLARTFEYVISAQLDEFCRLYGTAPVRLDGHHHMHLCANVILGKLLPAGTIVRRHFSFRPDDKSWGNRFYRRIIDRVLASRHQLTDFFFSLQPLEPARRLDGIFSAAQHSVVELETHPVNREEYNFLAGGEIL